MKTRIIIEKDGERWEVVSDYAVFIEADGRVALSTEKNTAIMKAKPLPPVIRTDNSAKCDCKDCAFRGMELCEQRKLMNENAKLREALKDVLDVHLCDGGTTPVSDALCAVRKAKEIMNGEKK